MVDENSTPLSKEYYEALLKSTKDICDLKLQEKDQMLLEKDKCLEEKDEIILEKDKSLEELQEIILDNDRKQQEYDVIIQEKVRIIKEKDLIIDKNDIVLQEKRRKLQELQSEIELSKKNFQEAEAERAKIASSVEQTEEARRAADKKLATCKACNHYYSDPVVTNCGHSFCRGCVQESGVDKFKDCPECHKKITSVCPSIVLKSLADRHHMEDVAELMARCSSSRVRNGMRGGDHECISKELVDEVDSVIKRLRGDPLYELLTHAFAYRYKNNDNKYYRLTGGRREEALSLDEVYYATNGECLQLSILAVRLTVATLKDPMYKPTIKRNLTLLDRNNRGGMSYLLRRILYNLYSVYGECLSCSSDNAPSDADVEESDKQSSNHRPVPPQTDTTSQDNSVESVVGKCSTCSQTLPGLPADRKVEALCDSGAFRWLDKLDELAVEDYKDDLENFFLGLTTVEQDTTKDLLANWAVYRLLGKNRKRIRNRLHWSGLYRPVQVSC